MVTARPVSAPAPTTFSASVRSIPLIRPRRRASSICAAADSGDPDNDEHSPDHRAHVGVVFTDAGLDRAQRGRIGVGQRALHRDLEHLGVKRSLSTPATSIRAHRLRHPQQQPLSLGHPVDRIDLARGAGADQQPSRKAICAQRDATAFPSAASGRQESTARSAPRVAAKAGVGGIERPHGPRVAPGKGGIFDRLGRRRKLDLGD